MLKKRIIAALIAAPLVILALFYTSPAAFAVLFLIIAGIGLYEWGNLAGLKTLLAKVSYILIYCLSAGLLFYTHSFNYALGLASMFWLLALLMVLIHPKAKAWLEIPLLHLAAGLLVILGAWSGLLLLKTQAHGEWLLVWIMVLVWGADVGAYFSGKAFGKNKLAPHISPGKTWEGVLGGIVLSVSATMLLVNMVPSLQQSAIPAWIWLILALFLAGLSVVGDLFESILKRNAGMKDSGAIFPGHGGLLDRIDALIAAIPVFAGFIYLA